ncbi:hypothetical protein [Phytomonospora endophytica]|uniref:Uncharacterized protein n=1 Tax=Phytomonospora endophytica TaxID=714109 RepID=A0A841FRS7_9ACTN|nr:hypothetical protein [Phytomonospora endophytica]MBB6038494.1 hypothetical protein [Phytomonospora endophytica]GIG64424.1 hypothetical protein Pen01_07190 [Phytomonospora endophytica]
MTPSIAVAALQILIGLAFVSIPWVRARYGPRAQAAAEAELTRQGVRPEILGENKLRFDHGGHETIVPVTVALVMGACAALNIAGASIATPANWIFQTLVLLGNAAILYSNLTAVKGVETAFAKKGGELAAIDVKAFLTAAENAFPKWVFSILQNIRHVIAFGGSIAILIITAVA